ncbi:aminoglycoside phosphotransferase family protein [Salinactinospora qingdaonensis]|uniref:Aminoglycoside phosphotransferase family protein n=1 Tax=Salinactinospora qingdaonensis TaxID=702744 RepID=A0ABP7GEW3_9ACTN
MDIPAAEIAITPELVAKLLRTQHPDLADRRLTPVANGWDNAIYRLGEDMCIRLPRRQLAADLVDNEQRWLPGLASRLEVAIPAPLRRGEPSPDYPWAWSITPWFPGQAALDIAPAQRGAIAADLARFLTALHIPAPAAAPRNPVRGVALASRAPAVHERLDSGRIPRADELRRLWDELAALPLWAGPPLWLHGDLHPANLILTHRGDTTAPRLAAVIDFGDLTSGDPATDLAAAWLVFDAEAHARFRAHLDQRDDIDATTWGRARGWALNLGVAIAASSDDTPRMAALAAHTLQRVLTHP